MNKRMFLVAAAAALAMGSGIAWGQGHGGGGGRDGASGGWQGGGGGRAATPGGSWRGGGTHDRWQGGGNRGSWNGNNWRGGGGWYAGRYGPRAGFYRSGPRVWGGWPYLIYQPYPIYAAPPYPVYVDPGPTVYVERYPSPAYAEAAPPTYVQPPVAPTPPETTPQDEVLERYTLSARELFEFDRAVLRLPQPKLDQIATILVRNPQINHVTISGYTDRIGTDSYNLKLSQRRADAVKTYLVGKGVSAIRLTAVGKGKSNPVVECHEKSRPALIKCLEPNRRVEVEPITVERRMR